jgi:hypothetical protein
MYNCLAALEDNSRSDFIKDMIACKACVAFATLSSTCVLKLSFLSSQILRYLTESCDFSSISFERVMTFVDFWRLFSKCISSDLLSSNATLFAFAQINNVQRIMFKSILFCFAIEFIKWIVTSSIKLIDFEFIRMFICECIFLMYINHRIDNIEDFWDTSESTSTKSSLLSSKIRLIFRFSMKFFVHQIIWVDKLHSFIIFNNWFFETWLNASFISNKIHVSTFFLMKRSFNVVCQLHDSVDCWSIFSIFDLIIV